MRATWVDVAGPIYRPSFALGIPTTKLLASNLQAVPLNGCTFHIREWKEGMDQKPGCPNTWLGSPCVRERASLSKRERVGPCQTSSFARSAEMWASSSHLNYCCDCFYWLNDHTHTHRHHTPSSPVVHLSKEIAFIHLLVLLTFLSFSSHLLVPIVLCLLANV